MELQVGELDSLLLWHRRNGEADQAVLLYGRALLECMRSCLPAMIQGGTEKYVPTPAFEKIVVVFIDESGSEGYGVRYTSDFVCLDEN